MEMLEVDEEVLQQQREDWAESYATEQAQYRQAMQSEAWWASGAAVALASGTQRAGRGEAAGPGNTATDTSKPLERWCVTGGVDLLEVSIFGWFRDFDKLAKTLEAGRCAAMTKTASRRVDVASASLYLREKGHRWGNTFLSWVGEYDGITISIGRPSKSKRVPVAKVQIGSLKLMRDGHRAAWAHALRILDGLGIVVDRATVARIDLCADLPHVDCAGYVQAVLERRYVTRLKSQSAFYRAEDHGWTGVGIGKRGRVFLRLYDKVREIDDKSGPEREAKLFVLQERRWGGACVKATRAEFQIGGQWLRDRWNHCATVEEVFDRLASITEYLVTDYFRLTTYEPDRENNNQNLAPASPEWQAVVEAFQWTEEEIMELQPLEVKPVDRKRFDERLKNAALALAKSLGPGVVYDATTFVQGVVDSLVRTMPPSWEIRATVGRAWEETRAAGLDGVADFSAPDQLSPGWVVTLTPEGDWPDEDEW